MQPRRIAMALSALAVLCSASTALAQPDPFEDYERMKRGEPLEPADGGGPSGTCEPCDEVTEGENRPSLEQLTLSVGLRTQLSYTGTSNELESGAGSEDNNTLFYRLAPTVGLMVLDRLEVALSLGLLGRSVSLDRGADSSESAFLIEASGGYHVPVGDRIDLIPGVALGAYFGGGSRALAVTSESGRTALVEEETSTSGVSLGLSFGVGYHLTDALQLRSGLVLNGLIGSESIASSGVSLGTSSAHLGLPIELHYSFF